MKQLPLLVLAEILASASVQSAPTLTWLGPASGSWLVPANWSSPPVFDGTETFRFDGSSAGTPALLFGNFDVFRIENSVTNHDLASGGFIPRTLRLHGGLLNTDHGLSFDGLSGIRLMQHQTWTCDSGSILIQGPLDLNGKTLALKPGPTGKIQISSPAFSGSGGLNIDGGGFADLTENSTYSGPTNVSDAVVIVRANTALGANGILDYTMVAAGGCVALADNGLVIPESLAISGDGVVGYNGAIMQLPPSIPGGFIGGSRLLAPVYLDGNSTLYVAAGAGHLTVDGGVIAPTGKSLTTHTVSPSGLVELARLTLNAGGLNVLGAGTTRLLSASGPNTFSGDTLIQGGFLLTFGAEALSANSRLVMEQSSTLPILNPVLATAGATQTCRGIEGTTGRINMDVASVLKINAAAISTFDGIIAGTDASLRIIGGAQILRGDNTYTGYTSVEDCSLEIGGKHTGPGSIDVRGGVLYGVGTVPGKILVRQGTLFGQGTFRPGDHIASSSTQRTFTCGELETVAGESRIHFRFGEGAANDSIKVTKPGGQIILFGTMTLQALPGYLAPLGTVHTLIDNQTGNDIQDAVYYEGQLIADGTRCWKISHHGGPTGKNLTATLLGQNYNDWATHKFGSIVAPNSLPAADPDHDGLDNLSEYAFGSEPLVPGTVAVAFTTEPFGASPHGGITFPYLSLNKDLIYTAQRSDDLLAWEDIGQSNGSSFLPLGPGNATFTTFSSSDTLPATVRMIDSGEISIIRRRFFRVKLTLAGVGPPL